MNPEEKRNLALLMYRVLETADEREFDDIAFLASEVCSAPIALISFIDHDRQWFKARVGFGERETGITKSVCRFVVESGQALIIPDLTLDTRTKANPLVTAPDGLRFYAGQPIKTRHGVIGALCVLDRVPRSDGLSDRAMACLAALSRLTVDRLEARRMASKYDDALIAIRGN